MLDMRVNASTQRYAVLGESLKHTWSPFIHNSLFSASKRDAIYLPVTIPKAQLSSAVDVLRSCFCGFNVTIPYKESIIPYLDDIDDAAKACGAVNTVENQNGRLIGHITDGLGSISALQKGGIRTNGVDALILGGGGAARVVAYEILIRGGKVTFSVRNLEKGQRLAQEIIATLPSASTMIDVCLLGQSHAAHDILINCTPVGMYPNADAAPVPEEIVSRCKAVFDAVYNPRQTRLLEMARIQEIPCVEGIHMLFEQAVEAQKIWFGQGIPSVEDQKRILDALLTLL